MEDAKLAKEEEQEKKEKHEIDIPEKVPLIALRDLVLYPYMIVPLYIGREKSVKAVDNALAENRIIMLATQKDGSVETPDKDTIYDFGCLAGIMRMLKLSDGRIRLLVQGVSRARVTEYVSEDPFFQVRIEKLADNSRNIDAYDLKTKALFKNVKDSFEKIAELNKMIMPDIVIAVKKIEQIGKACDIIAGNLGLNVEEHQELLQQLDEQERLKKIHGFLNRELELLNIQQKIQDRAKGNIDKVQKEYYLKQQLKAIKEELGETDSRTAEVKELRQKLKQAKVPKYVKQEAEKQISRLESMYPESAEASTIRTYLDWLLLLPWKKSSKDNLDIIRAEKVLHEDHYDLKDVKERILEFLSVTKLKKKLKGPILCFVGPPGVGKTSLGKSIARALGRKFVRISLGGIRDEAEIRGHRRTYVGALPGRVIQEVRRAGTNNPVFMLDEIDKVGSDFRGDPSSALLEALDPEQNDQFSDHYLGLPFDLSRVMFITTANVLDTIPRPLLDRMEVLRIPGYTVNDKFQIAKKYLIPRSLSNTGVTAKDIHFSAPALRGIILNYTAEAGVRNLERQIAKVCRKVARQIAQGRKRLYKISERSLKKYLGPVMFLREKMLQKDEVGIATGLAWTAFGGEVLFVECLGMPGTGKIKLTGSLGEVMKESAMAALSLAKANQQAFKLKVKDFGKLDLHIHVPEGATPKDGPSAGITIVAAIISCLSGRPVRRDIAMTGEITLTGKVLPIGGVKEKALAAKLAGIHTVIIPKKNEKDIVGIPAAIKRNLEFLPVERIDQVIDLALHKQADK